MDEALANRLVRELADAIAAAAAGDARVEACHAKARESGLELKVALAAEVRSLGGQDAAASPVPMVDPAPEPIAEPAPEPRVIVSPPAVDLSEADRRFLKALRISSNSSASGRR
ncbi:MAG: hypothetical protein WCP29_08295 [Acidobacteriota bacterium]